MINIMATLQSTHNNGNGGSGLHTPHNLIDVLIFDVSIFNVSILFHLYTPIYPYSEIRNVSKDGYKLK